MIPAAKKIGKELLLQAAPELIEFATKKINPKQALKSTVSKTVKKQVGGGSRSRKGHSKKNNAGETKNKTRHSQKKNSAQRIRSDFFTRVKNDF